MLLLLAKVVLLAPFPQLEVPASVLASLVQQEKDGQEQLVLTVTLARIRIVLPIFLQHVAIVLQERMVLPQV